MVGRGNRGNRCWDLKSLDMSFWKRCIIFGIMDALYDTIDAIAGCVDVFIYESVWCT
jgi:hypothetical protein